MFNPDEMVRIKNDCKKIFVVVERFRGMNYFDEYCHSYKIILCEKWSENVSSEDENVIEKDFEELELFRGNANDYIESEKKELEKYRTTAGEIVELLEKDFPSKYGNESQGFKDRKK